MNIGFGKHAMRIGLLPALLLLSYIFASPLLADELVNITDFEGCQAIPNDKARLLCYDTVAKGGIYNEEKQTKKRYFLGAAVGISIFAAFLIRTQGIVLLGSLIIYQVIQILQNKDNHKSLLIIFQETLVIIGTFGLLWGISELIFPGGQVSYFTLYADLSLNLFFSNIRAYTLLFSDFFAGFPGHIFLYFVALSFFIVGLITRIKEAMWCG